MFYTVQNSTLVVNCGVAPDSDVSGVGVRGALYFQAAVMIVLSFSQLKKDPHEILFWNLSMQTTSLALISATYFDPTVDIVHTLVASQFSVLFSTCRITLYELPPSVLRSSVRSKSLSRLWILDTFFRTCLVAFNFQTWLVITRIQRHDKSICSEGFGQWV